MRRFAFAIACSLAATCWVGFVDSALAGQKGHGPAAPVAAQAAKPLPPVHPAKPAHPETPKPKPPEPKPPTPLPSARPAPFFKHIERNPLLTSRLQALLPAGMTLASASQGFKKEGQFIAALHVAHNLNIPFAQLKTELTGEDHDKLGVAIQELKPGVDAKAAVRAANREAEADLKATKPPKPLIDKDRDNR